MPEGNSSYAIRLETVGGARARAELIDTARAAEDASQRTARAAREASGPVAQVGEAFRAAGRDALAFGARIPVFGPLLSNLGPTGRLAAAGIAAVGTAMVEGTRAAAQKEIAFKRVEAVLRATGGQAGVTGREIQGFAQSLSAATRASEEAALDASAALATFGGVGAENFRRVLSTAQDLAALGFGDLRSNVETLGRLFEDPVAGAQRLNRQLGFLSPALRRTIEEMAETGDAAGAAALVMAALEKRVGGAGAAEADSLAGRTQRLTKLWGDLLEKFEQSAIAKGAVDALTQAVRALNVATGETREARIVAIDREVARLRAEGAAETGPSLTAARAARDALTGGPSGEFGRHRAREAEQENLIVARVTRDRNVKAEAALERARKEAAGGAASSERLAIDGVLAEARRMDTSFDEARMRRPDRDLARAVEAERSAARRANEDIAAEGERVRQRLMTADERYFKELDRLHELRAADAIDDETLVRGQAAAMAELERATKKSADETSELARAFEGFGRRSARTLADVVTGLDKTNASADRLLLTLGSEILESMIYKNITAPASSAASGFLDGLFADLFHEGGVVGEGGRRRAVSPAAFAAAPRMHGGGLLADERPAILQVGEEVITTRDPRHARNGGAAGGVNVHYHVDARGADAGLAARLPAILEQTKQETIDIVFGLMEQGGRYSRAVGRRV